MQDSVSDSSTVAARFQTGNAKNARRRLPGRRCNLRGVVNSRASGSATAYEVARTIVDGALLVLRLKGYSYREIADWLQTNEHAACVTLGCRSEGIPGRPSRKTIMTWLHRLLEDHRGDIALDVESLRAEAVLRLQHVQRSLADAMRGGDVGAIRLYLDAEWRRIELLGLRAAPSERNATLADLADGVLYRRRPFNEPSTPPPPELLGKDRGEAA